MIAFDLECPQGHGFEGWFDSHDSFEEQKQDGLVRCPYCDDTDIKRVLSAVSVKKARTADMPNQGKPGSIDYRRLAREVVDYIKKNSEDVGAEFASEALKIHYGVAEKRSIRGSATEDEENTLKEEGVEFVKVPFPVSDDKKTN
ncbi:MAG: DUF1178 family protein [Deltaproteobacteria bacterium]